MACLPSLPSVSAQSSASELFGVLCSSTSGKAHPAEAEPRLLAPELHVLGLDRFVVVVADEGQEIGVTARVDREVRGQDGPVGKTDPLVPAEAVPSPCGQRLGLPRLGRLGCAVRREVVVDAEHPIGLEMRGDDPRLGEVLPKPEQFAVPTPLRRVPAEEGRAAADEIVDEEDEGEPRVGVAERLPEILEGIVPLGADDTRRREDLLVANDPRVRVGTRRSAPHRSAR